MVKVSLVPPTASRWIKDPTISELVLMQTIAIISFAITLIIFHGWRGAILRFGDNAAYLEVATAIRYWDFRGIDIQHFMGYPYAIAALSLMSHLPLVPSLWLVAIGSSVVSTLLVARLLGTRVAAYFAFANFSWLQLSFLGGSEPLAVALGMGSFLAYRRGHTLSAVLLASLATTVRPLMFFSLVGIGIALLCQKNYTKLFTAVLAGASIGLLYVWPLAHYFGDPLRTVHSYTSRDYGAAKLAGPHGHLFGWPFHGIIVGAMTYRAPWTNVILSFSWILLVIAGAATMFRRDLRLYWRQNIAHAVFCGLYIVTIFCYDYLAWAASNFIRFSIPVLPFVFFALLRWLPSDRRVVWCLSIVAPVLAACSAIGIRNIHLQ